MAIIAGWGQAVDEAVTDELAHEPGDWPDAAYGEKGHAGVGVLQLLPQGGFRRRQWQYSDEGAGAQCSPDAPYLKERHNRQGLSLSSPSPPPPA